MNMKAFVLVVLIAFSTFAMVTFRAEASELDPVEYWAVLVCGAVIGGGGVGGAGDVAYAFHVLNDHY